MFGVGLDDGPDLIREKGNAGFRGRGVPEEAIELCTVAIERLIAAKVLHEAPGFSADELKENIYEIALQAWREEAAAMPVVMVSDDLHWADQASVDLLTHLFSLTEEVPILFVCAFRPERQAPAWRLKLTAETDYPHRYTEIALQPLGSDESDALVSALLRAADLPAELRRQILDKTEGNPYFVEEVVRSLIDEGVLHRSADGLHWTTDRVVGDIALPGSLQGLLTARIDRLQRDVRATLQLAAVIGRSFYHRVLSAISDSAASVDGHLSALQRVELVDETARSPELEYMFRHELARDAAYQTILLRNRRDLHRHVGEAIEALFPDRVEENAHRLAYHFAEAGDHERSLSYYAMAGESAARIGATTEATAHYEHAIERAGVSHGRWSELRERRADVLRLEH